MPCHANPHTEKHKHKSPMKNNKNGLENEQRCLHLRYRQRPLPRGIWRQKRQVENHGHVSVEL